MIPLSIWEIINFIPGISITVRRYHDVGISGLWYFATPFLGDTLIQKASKYANYYENVNEHKFILVIDLIGIIIELISLVIILKPTKFQNNKYIHN
ncbi:hypothetical protein WR164_15780 [Philodulcilactobacillus myokoensis]|uniref:DUF805 domain-containing protein n=2 Tax=Philodulcilactobacillus myokoensis TaxID=2929573 RepID=A0A9W6B285_9LACO|nr:hypothetical protein WR164_15780 [Philodulcilactobacillus myokoensis]